MRCGCGNSQASEYRFHTHPDMLNYTQTTHMGMGTRKSHQSQPFRPNQPTSNLWIVIPIGIIKTMVARKINKQTANSHHNQPTNNNNKCSQQSKWWKSVCSSLVALRAGFFSLRFEPILDLISNSCRQHKYLSHNITLYFIFFYSFWLIVVKQKKEMIMRYMHRGAGYTDTQPQTHEWMNVPAVMLCSHSIQCKIQPTKNNNNKFFATVFGFCFAYCVCVMCIYIRC